MTPSELSAIRARLDAATPGPWEAVTPKRYAAVRSERAGCYVYTQGKIPADAHPDTVARQQRDAHLIANAPTDLRALLDEVERLENDFAMARQVSGELCEACGWAMKFPGEPCRCELLAQVERLTADPLPAAAWVREVERAAFARGAEAMREAAAQACEVSPIHGQKTTTARRYADAIRALPVPEDKP